MINITVESSFERYSHYDVIVMCGGFNTSAEQLYVVSAQKVEGESVTQLCAEEAPQLEVITYIIPRSLPGTKDSPIVDNPPFEALITISSSHKELHRAVHEVNAWGGAAIRLVIEN